jgi:hypothetical protein
MTKKFQSVPLQNLSKFPLNNKIYNTIIDVFQHTPGGNINSIRPEFISQIGQSLVADPDFINSIELIIISVLCKYELISEDYCVQLPTSRHIKNINFLNLINENDTDDEDNSNICEFSELSIENDDVKLKIDDNDIEFSELSIENDDVKLKIDDNKDKNL